MNPSSSQSMAPLFFDYQQRSTNLRSKILKNEEQRMQLEQKLRLMSNNNSHSYKNKQIQHIKTYFTRLNQESQRAEQRNLQLLNNLTQAQQHLDKLHSDAENLIRLKNDYLNYLELHYPNWQKPTLTRTSTNINSSNEYDHLGQHIKQHDQLESDGNLRQSMPIVRQSYDVESSMLFKRYEDQLKVGLERTTSPSTPIINNEIKDQQQQQQQQDEQSITELNAIVNPFSRVKNNGSLRMELTPNGLYFLLDYIENELKDTIDKNKFYRLDPPTITQKRTIIDIGNDKQKSSLKDLDPATTSMVILDQLPSTIRRTTKNNCLLTDDILSSNIKDLDKDIISQMLPAEDRSLWLRLIEHFSQLLKLHIMNSQILTNKFAIALLPTNAIYAHDKAKSLLKHVIEKYMGTQSSSSDDETSFDRKQKQKPVQQIIQTNTASSSSLWLKKLANGSVFDDDDESTSSSITKKTNQSPSSTATTPKANRNRNDNNDDEFFD
ncbi:unnamed protein product [Rotaria sp. Silwood2]|nr:unnamed protein product [Rotaria sp. Silwood2]CAF2525502.1 unnamed protein product [Rotaria sp. Silwood2]CAF2960194.1 unnamed protein product [Rotaria sp. Silwood2]CAF3859906.1 unnamed protein product [Rotaria sp. Silwood2]CAF3939713.1 unnamed protein product [Rotaria sp. Silwood2]